MIRQTQEGVVAVLLADTAVQALVAATPSGPAVFAPGQPFDDKFDRITIDTPQRIDRSTGCGVLADMIVLVHSWAKGPDCTLKAGDLADAAVAALSGKIAIAGHRVTAWGFEISQAVGDPQPDIEHVVSTLRYSLQPTG